MLKIIAMLAAIGAPDVSRKEINCMATAIYHEARGEEVMGQVAVAHVIMNRVKSEAYPDTICEVVYQHRQFSFIRHAKPNRDSDEWGNAVSEAVLAHEGYTDDPTNGAMHYFAHDIVYPRWAKEMKVSAVIGGHTFKVKKVFDKTNNK